VAISASAAPLQPVGAKPPSSFALWSLALAGFAAACGTLALAIAVDEVHEPVVRALLIDWVVVTYISAGLVAWWRKPQSRLGLLMVSAGFAVFLSTLSWTSLALPFSYDIPFTIGSALRLLPLVVFLHVYLAFPSGRVRGLLERSLVGATYVTAIGLALVHMLFGGLGPHNLLEISLRPAAAKAVFDVQVLTSSALCLLGIVVLVARRRRTGQPLRRSLALLVDSFLLALLAIAVYLMFVFFELPGLEWFGRGSYLVIGLAPFAFLLGLLDARLARSAVGELVIELRADSTPAALRNALARVLRDPSLMVAYWLPQFESWADLDGRPVELPAEGSGRSATLIDRDGDRLVALVHDPALDDEPELLAAVGAAAGLALENGRLHAEQQAHLEELRGSRARVIEAGQKERQRLERNLHDGND
jgi:hypothetical protein